MENLSCILYETDDEGNLILRQNLGEIPEKGKKRTVGEDEKLFSDVQRVFEQEVSEVKLIHAEKLWDKETKTLFPDNIVFQVVFYEETEDDYRLRLEETLNVLMAQINLLRKSGVKIILTLQEISPLGVLLEVYDEIQKDNSLDLKIEHITDDPNGTNSVLFHSPDIWVGQYPTSDNTSIALSKKKGIRQNNRYFVRIDGIIFTLFNVHTAYYEGKKAIDFLLKKLCLSEWNKNDYFVIVGDMNLKMTKEEVGFVSEELSEIGVTIDFVITPEDKLGLTTTNATYDVFITNIRKSI